MLFEKAEIMDHRSIDRAIARICHEILERNSGTDDLCLVGVLTRGVILANRIADKIYSIEGKRVPTGSIDITPFRDDLVDKESVVERSEINFSVDDKRIVIVDDVLYTGRSIRAAIEGLMKRGRPKVIQLAVLVDRGHRQLPIRPDFVGKNLPSSSNEIIKVYLSDCDKTERVVILSR